MARPITSEDLEAAEHAVSAIVAALTLLGIRANAQARNAMKMFAMNRLSGAHGTLVLSAHEHLDTKFTTGAAAEISSPLGPDDSGKRDRG